MQFTSLKPFIHILIFSSAYASAFNIQNVRLAKRCSYFNLPCTPADGDGIKESQDKGDFKEWLVDELMKDRTPDGKPSLLQGQEQKDEVFLTPASKVRLAKNAVLEGQIMFWARLAGAFISIGTLTILYLLQDDMTAGLTTVQ